MTETLKASHIHKLLLLLLGLFSIGVFVLDIYIPLGASGSLVYVLFVMATYWNEKGVTVGAGVAGTLLTIAGFQFSNTSEFLIISVINHILAIIVIWASVWFVNNYKASLLQIRRNYRVLFQAANDEILVFQLDDKNIPKPFFEVNNTACDMLGYTREELMDKSIYDITAAEKEEVNRLIETVVEQGDIVYESRHITKRGEIIPLELSIRSFTYNRNRAIITVGRDLRERRRLEQEILNVSEQERQRIGRDMHDDLGQLLTVANMTAQMLGHEMKSKDMEEAPKVQEIASLIKTAAENTRTLSHGLVPLNVEKNGLHSALQELAESISKMYEINITYTGDPAINYENNTAAVNIYRIAQEAVNNAVKHGNATSVEVELSSSAEHLTLRVKDNGSGISESSTINDGIGLRTMKFRANMMGGDLKISSEKGKGTEISCLIPKNAVTLHPI